MQQQPVHVAALQAGVLEGSLHHRGHLHSNEREKLVIKVH
jgi:hypothetical protein